MTTISPHDGGLEDTAVAATRIEIPFPMGEHKIETGQLALIPFLLSHFAHHPVYASPCVVAINRWKWNKYAGRIHIAETILYFTLFFIPLVAGKF